MYYEWLYYILYIIHDINVYIYEKLAKMLTDWLTWLALLNGGCQK